jgi:hypothetical protein
MSSRVARDPFARGEYARFCFSNTDSDMSCDWCGQKPKRLYAYLWESDEAMRRHTELDASGEKLFCNKQCFDSYHG